MYAKLWTLAKFIILFEFVQRLFISGKTALVRRYTEGKNLQFFIFRFRFLIDQNSRAQKVLNISVWLESVFANKKIAREQIEKKEKEMRNICASRFICFKDTCVKLSTCSATYDTTIIIIKTCMSSVSLHSVETVFSREVFLELQDYHRRRFCNKNVRLGSAH